MREISSQTLTFLNRKVGIDAAFVIEIQWSVNGQRTTYSDRTVDDIPGLKPQIIAIGELDQTKDSDSAGQTSSITITLDDIDGEIKDIFDNSDIHKRPVWVYQYFEGTNVTDKFLLFAGQIWSPIVWSEGQRTITFTIVSKIEDKEVGWSVEMGTYSSLPLKLIGQPWPMVFGTVYHVPGMALQEIPTAFITQPFGIPDASLIAELNKIQTLKGLLPTYNVARPCPVLKIWTDEDCDQEAENDRAWQEGKALQAKHDDYSEQIQELTLKLNEQRVWQKGRVPLLPTIQVKQAYHGLFKVGNGLFIGSLSDTGGFLNTQPQLEPGSYDITKQLIKAGWQFYNAGTQATIVGNYEIPFVVSIVPGTVTAVYAFQSFRGLRKLTVVPPSYYTIETRNYGVDALCVILKKPLSTVAFNSNLNIQNWENNFGQYLPAHVVASIDWEDDIYATVVSSVGPNPVDIMIYLIERYSTNTYHATNFNAVKAKVAITPFNFMYQSKSDLFSLLTELAYQCRCAIYLVDDVFTLKYLVESGEEVDEIDESDVEVGTLEVTTTPTEDIVTVYTATFRPDYSPTYSEPIRSIFRFNINKYGYREEEHDFFALNAFDVVEKVATFWMIRKSMTWKILRCKLHLNKLNLEVFDTVLLNFNRKYVAKEPVKAMVINARYSTEDKSIAAEFWVPVRLGEMVPYEHVWDIGITRQDFFPTYRDIQAGSSGGQGGGQQMELPPWNMLMFDIQRGNRTNYTQGDPTPLGEYGANLDWAPFVSAPAITVSTVPQSSPNLEPYHYPEPGAQERDVTREWSKTFPGTIKEFQEIDEKGRQTYTVDIYRKGIDNAGTETAAKCLQLDREARIPNKTAVYVMENSYKKSAPDAGTNGIVTERIIQVPIWLR